MTPTPGTRDLCTIQNVTDYVPAYVSDETTDQKLQDLITSESQLILKESAREIVPFGDQPATRAFAIDHASSRQRQVNIGDLSSAGDTDVTVELVGRNDVVLQTIARAHYHAIYGTKRQPLESWEPVTTLAFPFGLGAQQMLPGQTLLVTGNWGFPEIPAFIKEACAKRVILRYVSDVAAAGTTPFAAALDNLNLAAMFASARDAVDSITQGFLVG